ncbi:MAG: DEAD/DEAH box helicase, partial [Planctomycetota bacterium]|nr:DEAD/DEAH box helicase [Planctomycetota bacterium]
MGDSGVSPYRAHGELVLLRERTEGAAAPKLDIPSIPSWAEPDVRRKEEIILELQARVSAIGIPQVHPFWGCRHRVLLPANQERLLEALSPVQESLARLISANAGLADALGLSGPAGRPESEGLCLAARKAMAAPDLAGVHIRSQEWRTRWEEVDALARGGSELARLRERYDPVLAPEAWTQDLVETRWTLDTKGRSWLRLLSGEYRQAKNRLAGLCRGSLPAGADAKVELVDAVAEFQRLQVLIRRHEPLGQGLFGSRWQGEGSDWAALSPLTAWLTELYDDVDAGRVPEGIIDFLAGDSPVGGLEPLVAAVEEAGREHGRNTGNLVQVLDLDVAKRFGAGPGLDDQPFDTQKEALDAWSERGNDIHDIVSFNNISDTCRNEGLDAVLAAAESWPPAGDHLLDAFHLAWFEGLLERALGEREALAAFDGNSHQQVVDRFRDLDALSLRHNRARLALAHWEELPRQEGGGQLGVLRREFQKRRRHLAIRQLIERAGNAVQAVKPVFMMSPLSIATYISPGSLKFDLVVFDEASQVKPVDAFGAIMRSGQAVVVGDSQQLPPTSFFDSMAQGSEDDDGSVTADIESVLGLFSAQSAPGRMLRWHYRSRHESLIAVSNREFYNNSLVVFPSPDAERRESGLNYHLLPDTVYDRGGSRTNQLEAEAVARAVMEHARTHPALTLGVAAFSVAQMRAVLDQMELLRRENP